jgi:hypothetical protein
MQSIRSARPADERVRKPPPAAAQAACEKPHAVSPVSQTAFDKEMPMNQLNSRELAVIPVGPGIDTEAVENFLENGIRQERDHFQRNPRAVKLRRYLNDAELAPLNLGPGTLLAGTRLSDGRVMWALYPVRRSDHDDPDSKGDSAHGFRSQ